ncbi:phytoene desaturase family protein [Planococcus chinensis]|uniref:Phytoene desaturase family protein n=1 Tax=Planococcus chinensis TaxID=272917 RepID=A0ABW4QDI3_9BACL
MKKIIVIGGGLGGLAAAVTLAHAGFHVRLFEKNRHLGGKLMPVHLGSYSFDFGPNTITMPQVFKGIIEQTGERAEDYFDLIPLQSHTRNHFPDGATLDFSSDAAEMEKEIARFSSRDAANYSAFLKEVARLYGMSERYFFPATFQSWKDYVSPSLGLALLRARPAETLHHFFSRYFSDKRLIQSLDRYATYIGSSPFKAPATFSMIAHLELAQGVYYTKGGNVRIAEAFAAVAQKHGAILHTETEVQKILIENGQATGVVLADGRTFEADLVILNGDLLSAYPKLVEERFRSSFTDDKIRRFEPSISAFVITAGLSTRLPGLKHHNVFFSGDYQQEFDDLFSKQRYSEEPTVYISNSSYTDSDAAPEGDNLFILVNAPALASDGSLQIKPELYKERIYDFLQTYGLDIRSHVVEERVFTPVFLKDKFNAYRGSLYGPSSHRKADAFLRPANASTDIENLFFIGGSTHPGGGSPIVTMGGQNLARQIISKHKT